MTDTKHTPGPWISYPADDFGDHTIGHEGDALAVAAVVSNLRPAVEVEANARLIAAAPETAAERDRLKEVNKELRDALVCMVALGKPFFTDDAQRLTISLAKDALTKYKAEGKS